MKPPPDIKNQSKDSDITKVLSDPILSKDESVKSNAESENLSLKIVEISSCNEKIDINPTQIHLTSLKEWSPAEFQNIGERKAVENSCESILSQPENSHNKDEQKSVESFSELNLRVENVISGHSSLILDSEDELQEISDVSDIHSTVQPTELPAYVSNNRADEPCENSVNLTGIDWISCETENTSVSPVLEDVVTKTSDLNPVTPILSSIKIEPPDYDDFDVEQRVENPAVDYIVNIKEECSIEEEYTNYCEDEAIEILEIKKEIPESDNVFLPNKKYKTKPGIMYSKEQVTAALYSSPGFSGRLIHMTMFHSHLKTLPLLDLVRLEFVHNSVTLVPHFDRAILKKFFKKYGAEVDKWAKYFKIHRKSSPKDKTVDSKREYSLSDTSKKEKSNKGETVDKSKKSPCKNKTVDAEGDYNLSKTSKKEKSRKGETNKSRKSSYKDKTVDAKGDYNLYQTSGKEKAYEGEARDKCSKKILKFQEADARESDNEKKALSKKKRNSIKKTPEKSAKMDETGVNERKLEYAKDLKKRKKNLKHAIKKRKKFFKTMKAAIMQTINSDESFILNFEGFEELPNNERLLLLQNYLCSNLKSISPNKKNKKCEVSSKENNFTNGISNSDSNFNLEVKSDVISCKNVCNSPSSNNYSNVEVETDQICGSGLKNSDCIKQDNDNKVCDSHDSFPDNSDDPKVVDYGDLHSDAPTVQLNFQRDNGIKSSNNIKQDNDSISDAFTGDHNVVNDEISHSNTTAIQINLERESDDKSSNNIKQDYDKKEYVSDSISDANADDQNMMNADNSHSYTTPVQVNLQKNSAKESFDNIKHNTINKVCESIPDDNTSHQNMVIDDNSETTVQLNLQEDSDMKSSNIKEDYKKVYDSDDSFADDFTADQDVVSDDDFNSNALSVLSSDQGNIKFKKCFLHTSIKECQVLLHDIAKKKKYHYKIKKELKRLRKYLKSDVNYQSSQKIHDYTGNLKTSGPNKDNQIHSTHSELSEVNSTSNELQKEIGKSSKISKPSDQDKDKSLHNSNSDLASKKLNDDTKVSLNKEKYLKDNRNRHNKHEKIAVRDKLLNQIEAKKNKDEAKDTHLKKEKDKKSESTEVRENLPVFGAAFRIPKKQQKKMLCTEVKKPVSIIDRRDGNQPTTYGEYKRMKQQFLKTKGMSLYKINKPDLPSSDDTKETSDAEKQSSSQDNLDVETLSKPLFSNDLLLAVQKLLKEKQNISSSDSKTPPHISVSFADSPKNTHIVEKLQNEYSDTDFGSGASPPSPYSNDNSNCSVQNLSHFSQNKQNVCSSGSKTPLPVSVSVTNSRDDIEKILKRNSATINDISKASPPSSYSDNNSSNSDPHQFDEALNKSPVLLNESTNAKALSNDGTILDVNLAVLNPKPNKTSKEEEKLIKLLEEKLMKNLDSSLKCKDDEVLQDLKRISVKGKSKLYEKYRILYNKAKIKYEIDPGDVQKHVSKLRKHRDLKKKQKLHDSLRDYLMLEKKINEENDKKSVDNKVHSPDHDDIPYSPTASPILNTSSTHSVKSSQFNSVPVSISQDTPSNSTEFVYNSCSINGDNSLNNEKKQVTENLCSPDVFDVFIENPQSSFLSNGTSINVNILDSPGKSKNVTDNFAYTPITTNDSFPFGIPCEKNSSNVFNTHPNPLVLPIDAHDSKSSIDTHTIKTLNDEHSTNESESNTLGLTEKLLLLSSLECPVSAPDDNVPVITFEDAVNETNYQDPKPKKGFSDLIQEFFDTWEKPEDLKNKDSDNDDEELVSSEVHVERNQDFFYCSEENEIYLEKAFAQPDLDKVKGVPLLGLQYILEVQKESGACIENCSYICSLCSKKMSSVTLTAHVKSVPHRLKYTEKHCEDIYSKYGTLELTQWTAALVREFTAELLKVEALIGREKLAVTKESNFANAIGILKKKIESCGKVNLSEPAITVDSIQDTTTKGKRKNDANEKSKASSSKRRLSPRNKNAGKKSPECSSKRRTKQDSRPSKRRSTSPLKRALPSRRGPSPPLYRLSRRLGRSPSPVVSGKRPLSPSSNRRGSSPLRRGGHSPRLHNRKRSPSPPRRNRGSLPERSAGGRRMSPKDSHRMRDPSPRRRRRSHSRSPVRYRSSETKRRSRSPMRYSKDGSDERRIKEFRIEENRIQSLHIKELEQYLREPESHPRYNSEWVKFWENRFQEVEKQGGDPNNHDYKTEWISFWHTRLKEICTIEFEGKRLNLLFKYNISDPDKKETSFTNERKPLEFEKKEESKLTPISQPRIDVGKDTPPFLRNRRERSPSPWERDTGRTKLLNPPKEEPKIVYELEFTVVGTLKLLNELEDQLGSFAPSVNTLLEKAIEITEKGEKPMELFNNKDNFVLLKLSKEKLSSQVSSGILGAMNAAKTQMAIESASWLQKESEKLYPVVSTKVLNLDINLLSTATLGMDTIQIAQYIAQQLLNIGKSDCSEEDLRRILLSVSANHSKLNTESSTPSIPLESNVTHNVPSTAPQSTIPALFPSGAQVSKANTATPSPTPPTENKTSATSTDTTSQSSVSGLSLLQSAYDDKTKDMDKLSLEDLQKLLSNFINLNSQEQKNLTNYLKKLEATDSKKVTKLRAMMHQSSMKSQSKVQSKTKAQEQPTLSPSVSSSAGNTSTSTQSSSNSFKGTDDRNDINIGTHYYNPFDSDVPKEFSSRDEKNPKNFGGFGVESTNIPDKNSNVNNSGGFVRDSQSSPFIDPWNKPAEKYERPEFPNDFSNKSAESLRNDYTASETAGRTDFNNRQTEVGSYDISRLNENFKNSETIDNRNFNENRGSNQSFFSGRNDTNSFDNEQKRQMDYRPRGGRSRGHFRGRGGGLPTNDFREYNYNSESKDRGFNGGWKSTRNNEGGHGDWSIPPRKSPPPMQEERSRGGFPPREPFYGSGKPFGDNSFAPKDAYGSSEPQRDTNFMGQVPQTNFQDNNQSSAYSGPSPMSERNKDYNPSAVYNSDRTFGRDNAPWSSAGANSWIIPSTPNRFPSTGHSGSFGAKSSRGSQFPAPFRGGRYRGPNSWKR